MLINFANDLPAGADALTRFAWGFMQRPIFAMPQLDSHFDVDGVTELILLRQGDFKVELVTARPGFVIPPHVHPDVDTYEVFIRGMVFTHLDRTVVSEQRCMRTDEYGLPAFRYLGIRVRPGEVHGGHAGPQGGVFLSIQRWLNGTDAGKPITTNWAGPTLGVEHDEHYGRTRHA